MDEEAIRNYVASAFSGVDITIAVLNPSDTTFERLKPLLLEAYQIAVNRVESRSSTRT